MTSSTKNLDPAFQGVGHRAGTEIWRIENFQPVPLQKSEYGRFYSGDSYIVLQTIAGKGGSYLYDIHFWLGKDTSQDEAGTAAIKTVELDTVLGGRAVQHRELQGHESDKFLSYFKPCIVPLEGGVASGFRTNEEEKFETRLYICKGKRLVRLKQVPFVRSSLNHDDVFILDTENKIYQFNGANSNIQERAKALEVIQHLKEKYHEGTCEVAIVDDGKLVAESDSGEFWVLFGGFAPLGKKAVNEDDITPEATPGQLYSINDGQLQLEESTLSKGILENNKCYLLDCGSEIFIWVGRLTQLEERKAASKAAEEFIINENRPKTTCITQVIQGFETRSFKSKFEDWHAGSGAGTSGGEDGRGKVAALLKQQGVDVKGMAKGSVNEEVPALLEGGGKIEVWRINGSAKTSIPKEEIGKFYCGDCYIVLYTYHSGDKKDEYFLSCWLGKDSIEDDHMTSIQLANTMCASLKGKPVLGRFFQGKEPPQFIALFQPMVVLKGGVSSGYKDFIAEKNLNDETYVPDGIALLQISGTSTYNAKAIQVDAVATSLSSSSFFVLQSRNTLFIWQGNACAFEQQHWAAKVAEFLKPGGTLKHAKEGTESSAFWFALGGKKDYTSKKLAQDTAKDPHLYTFSLDKGKLEVTEVFNFSQDDLLTEDILILDTHAEVFVWVGNCVDPKEKQKAFEFGEKYIELAAALEGLSLDVPLYKVPERHEPCFFTAYFSWDSTKSSVQGNSFQKKLLLLFGTVLNAPEHSRDNSGSSDQGPTQRASALAALSSAFNSSSASAKSSERSNAPNHGGPTQRASALAALSSAFNPPPGDKTGAPKPSRSIQGSQRAAAVAALSTVLTAEQLAAAAVAAASGRISRTSSLDAVLAEIEKIEDAGSDMGDPLEVSTEEGMGGGESMSESEPEIEIAIDQTFTYEQLRSKSSNPITGIDYKRREAYLSEEEFEVVMGMAKEMFYSQPKWKQNLQKREADLF